MIFSRLNFQFKKFMHVYFHVLKVMEFHDNLRFRMFFLERNKKDAIFFVSGLILLFLPTLPLGDPLPTRGKGVRY